MEQSSSFNTHEVTGISPKVMSKKVMKTITKRLGVNSEKKLELMKLNLSLFLLSGVNIHTGIRVGIGQSKSTGIWQKPSALQ
jgi:hypothetical protein